MYEKQVFKDGLRVLAENGGDCSRYFSSKETSDLFTLGPVGRSLVMEKLQKLADGIILGLPEESLQNEVEGERSVHYSLGLTRHDTLYTECKPTESLVER